jgi:hypothetical protein
VTRRLRAARLAVGVVPCLALAVEAAAFALAKTELSVILAAEAYGLAGFAVFTMWRFARRRWALAPGVLALFATFVSVDYALTEDRVAGQWLGVVLALYSASVWAYFRLGPPHPATSPSPDQQPEGTDQAKDETTERSAAIRSRAWQRIATFVLLNIAVTVVALVAHLRPAGTDSIAAATPGLSTASGKTLTFITDTGTPGTPPVYGMTITFTIKAKRTGQGATAPQAINGEYEIASFTINVQHGSFAYDAQRFMFRSTDGRTYPAEDANSARAGFTPPPASVTVPAGHSLHGTLTFDVPRGGGEVQYLTGAGYPPPGWTTGR